MGLLSMVNDAREGLGLPTLPLREWLSLKARRHSRRMAKQVQLFHSDLSQVVSPHPYNAVGENVGTGPSLESVFAAFLSSLEHRANILNPRWRMTGIGVIRRGGRIWITQIFYD